MTLTTHAIIGAAAARLVSANPILGFFAAFASHFFVDAIPHGHYKLVSKVCNPTNPLEENMRVCSKGFLRDVIYVGLDCSLGIVLTLLIFQPQPLSGYIFAGVAGGILPDVLQFVYWKVRREPLTSLQRFHLWAHAKKRFNDKPVVAIFIETAVVAAAAVFVRAFLS
jgi:hypothetical protein